MKTIDEVLSILEHYTNNGYTNIYVFSEFIVDYEELCKINEEGKKQFKELINFTCYADVTEPTHEYTVTYNKDNQKICIDEVKFLNSAMVVKKHDEGINTYDMVGTAPLNSENDAYKNKPVGKKNDSGKPRWNLMPWKQLSKVVDVLTFGANEYGPGNWQKVENAEERYEAALYRHMTSWSSGDKIDPESKKTHLAHVICNALFLMYFEDNKNKAE